MMNTATARRKHCYDWDWLLTVMEHIDLQLTTPYLTCKWANVFERVTRIFMRGTLNVLDSSFVYFLFCCHLLGRIIWT